MDRKSILIIVLCVGLLVGWQALISKLYPPKPVPPGGTNSVAMVEGSTNALGTNLPAATPSTIPVLSASTNQFVVNTNTPEELLVVTHDNARYTFTSHGGGLKLVELLRYPETVRRKKDSTTGRVATLNSQAKVPVLAVLDGDAVQGDGIFQLTKTEDGIRAEKQLPNGLSIIKEFKFTTNYLIHATVQLQNTSTQPLSLPEQKWIIGTATPMNALDDGQTTVGWMWFNGEKLQENMGSSFFATRNFACMPRVPPSEYREGQSNVVWAAMHNQYFTLIAIPKDPATQMIARQFDLPKPTLEELRSNPQEIKEPKGYEGALVYPALTLQPNQATQRQFTLYAGPKEYRTLARIAAAFNNNVDTVMSFGWFGFFAKALLLGMNWMHTVAKIPYGWAIICITIIIKVLFWPLTAASTRSMKRLQSLQPQMKAIADKYKDDPMKRNQKTMEFMKENKVSPLGGCLPMLLQMPVFIGFFYMIRSAIELRGASFLWVPDLSRPDTLFTIPFLNFPFNLLPILMGGTMLWQSHLTPPSPGMDPMQQKMLRYMPLMFMVFLYNYSAGLALYWTVNNLLTILQTKLTKAKPTAPPATPKAPVLTPLRKKKK